MGRIDGKVAAITGGNSGIGLATAKRFMAEGAMVFVLDRTVESVAEGAIAIQGDVTRQEDLDRFYATIMAECGHLDVLFANAGIGNMAPLGAIAEADVDRIFGVNVKGTLFTVQKALPLMHNGGSIIMTASTAGVVGNPAFSVYSASKAAVRSFARCWAMDLKDAGIRINCVTPGATSTPGLRAGAESTGHADELFALFASQAPMGRIAQAEEIASVVLFLASDDSSFMTGSEVYADGGQAQV